MTRAKSETIKKPDGRARNGGYRANGGRKLGAATKKTREIANKVASDDGLTPLEVMVDNMRVAHTRAMDLEALAQLPADADKGSPDWRLAQAVEARKIAQDAAKDAAPYIHPRLATIEHTGPDGKALIVQVMKFADAPVEAPE